MVIMSINVIRNNLLIFLFLLFALVAQCIGADYGDKNLLLACARRLVEGKKLYQDVVELQPPLILLLYEIPVRLMQVIPLRDSDCLILFFLPVLLVSVMLSRRVTQHSEILAPLSREVSILMLFIVILFQNPSYFLDREHLMLVFTLPYLCMFLPSVQQNTISKPLQIAVGIMAAIGFCIKPHFILIFSGIGSVTCLRTCSFACIGKLANLTIYLLVSLYIGLICIFTPLYFTQVIPMAMATYSAYNVKEQALLYLPFCLLNLGIILADFRVRTTSPFRRDIYYLLSLLPFFALYIAMNNGWAYTWNLLISYILLINGWLLWEFRWLTQQHPSVKQFRFGLRASTINFSMNMVIINSIFAMVIFGADTKKEALSRLVSSITIASGESFKSYGALSLETNAWARMERKQHKYYETRFSNLWMLAKFAVSDEAFAVRHHWILAYVAEGLAEDMRINRPDIILVDNHSDYSIVPKPIDFLHYLLWSTAFATQWKQYYYVGDVDALSDIELKLEGQNLAPGHFHHYAVYKRNKE